MYIECLVYRFVANPRIYYYYLCNHPLRWLFPDYVNECAKAIPSCTSVSGPEFFQGPCGQAVQHPPIQVNQTRLEC